MNVLQDNTIDATYQRYNQLIHNDSQDITINTEYQN